MKKFRYMTEQEIREYLTGLEVELRTCSTERMREIDQEINDANEALATGEYRKSITTTEQRNSSPIGHTQILASYGMGTSQLAVEAEERAQLKEKFEQRGADLKAGKAVTFGINEFRTVTVGGGTLALPAYTSPTLNPNFNEVSGVVDAVNAPSLVGGESYKKGFVVGYGEGDYTGEGEAAASAEPTFDYVSTGKFKITAYAEVSSEAIKLSNSAYQMEVNKAVIAAVRKKASRQILIGTGTEEMTGIFASPTKVIPTATDLPLITIDADTLDTLVFGYGGDESIEGGCYLILNKEDLAAFAKVRDANGLKKLYKITIDPSGNTGTISSEDSYQVRFIINSACKAVSNDSTQVDDWCMAYGKPLAYEMPIFSELSVQRSTEYKFKEGLVCFKAEVYCGGILAGYKAFTRVKKAA